MDRRSWPWKKKSSDKANIEKTLAESDSTTEPLATDASQKDKVNKDSYKKPKYVQISVETYSHLTGLEDKVKSYEDQLKSYEDQVESYEDQVKSYEDQVNTYEDQIKAYDNQVQSLEDELKDMNENLSEAHAEMTTKEALVKQHAKVAEEAVSGWEKAEAETAALKVHLESVTLSKLTAEDRGAHLDGALKECMRQIRNLKEEHEQHIHDVMLTKSKQLDKVKLEFEAKIANLDQELLRSASDNAALSRSLQERSNMQIKMTEEKSQAEAEIEILKSNVDSCEREINSLKYELHIVAKELEIRNEEKNMSVRSAEVANKQHLEGVKKITKLEAECQRLRGLVRKKLPGPAALAQMKLEVESLGRDYGETRLRRSPVKPPSPQFPPLPEFSLDNLQKFHKENELLTERLLAMEEETKMLKEALAKRNSELQTSRNVCAKTVSKLQSLEAQLKGTTRSGALLPIEGLSLNASTPPSLTSMSEEGNDDAVSCAGSWATNLMSELSHVKKEKNIGSPMKPENSNHLELMDDFLEMEKLAYSSDNSSGAVISGSDSLPKDQPSSDASVKQKVEKSSILNPESDGDLLPIMKLQSKISVLLESLPKGADVEKVFEEISRVVQEMCHISHLDEENCALMPTRCSDATCDHEACSKDRKVILEKEIAFSGDDQGVRKTLIIIDEELEAAISRIHDFVLLLGKETKSVQALSTEGDGLSEKLQEFSTAVTEVVDRKISLIDFVLCLSHVLGKASGFRFNVLGYENNEVEISSTDCIDKVALPENKVVQEPSEEIYANGCAHFSDSTSDPDIPHDGSFVPTSETKVSSWICSVEEFEQLKLEKENMVLDLARCTENLERTKSHLKESEQALAEVKSQLTSAQKSNGLAETQLKCMAESYNSLETRAEDLQKQVNLLRAKVETLDNELQEEKMSHQDAEDRCQDLLEQLQRIESCPAIDIDAKSNQERELAAYAEKLAECQETIFLLGKQMKGWRPQTESMGSPLSDRSQKGESFPEEEPTTSGGMNLHEAELADIGNESPINVYTAPFSSSESEGNNVLRSPVTSKHRPTKSGSSSSSSNPTPEKNARGFSRFFSTKGGKVSN